MADHNELGKEGEEVALRYLQSKSYAILETNWRGNAGELDIIARHRDQIAFIEVKTRSGIPFTDAERSITRQKQKKMVKLAHSYLLRSGITGEARFDILIILKKGEGEYDIRLIEDAFYPLL
ncbi:MAG: YraN family protein [Bacteroidia bacterium]